MPDLQRLGKYQILEEIGRGGFATVYRALDIDLGREVALKVLKPQWTDDEEAVTRFIREEQIVFQLNHPGIVTIYEVGNVDARLYMAMKLLPGKALDQFIKKSGVRFTWERTLNITTQVAAALDYAHKQGLVHRDIKPANLILDANDNDHVVLTDFGLVRSAEQASRSTGTTSGIIGTPEYIPPEMWENRPVTPASDVYSLACVVYEMLTGEQLFAADSGAGVMGKHVRGPEFPSRWPPGVPKDVVRVLRKALAREASERYAATGEFVTALRQCGSIGHNKTQPVSSRSMGLIAVALSLIGLCAVVAVSVLVLRPVVLAPVAEPMATTVANTLPASVSISPASVQTSAPTISPQPVMPAVTPVSTIAPPEPVQPTEVIQPEVIQPTPSIRSTQAPLPTQPAPTSYPANTPYLPHQTTSVGSGPFSAVTYSTGDTNVPAVGGRSNFDFIPRYIQIINPGTVSDGCGISQFNVDRIWFGAGNPTTVTIDGQPVGEITNISTMMRHGYIALLSLQKGQRICMTPVPSGGFHLIFGPYVYQLYDSYCARGGDC